MSPEQVTGAAVDHRTDIFAFGALVYEMVTGRRAFVRASSAETIAAILREDVPEVPAAAGVPQPLDRILRRCLEKNPAERFHSAHDVDIALEALLDRSSTASAPVALPPDRRRTASRGVILASMIAAVALIALTVVVWFGRGTGDQPRHAPHHFARRREDRLRSTSALSGTPGRPDPLKQLRGRKPLEFAPGVRS